ncbi:MAG TPA: GNAT family N-acetyltransferase [Puia sp.]|nr:GNAT family N-acetyltransferase [Puia sp.]
MGKQEYKVRNADSDEFEEIGKLMVGVYSQLDGFPKEAEQPGYYKMLANVGELTNKPGTELLAAISPDHRIAGAVVYFGDMQYYGSGGTATRETNASGFRLLAVAPWARGLGIGKLLTNECIRKAKAKDSAQMIIHTTAAMQTAWKMYESIGFTRSEDLDFMQGELPVYGFRLPLYRVINTTRADLDFVYWMFGEAIAYQKSKNFKSWGFYDKEYLQKEVDNRLQYKIIGGTDILCIFSVLFSDPAIWGKKENGDAIYLHRIVVNPNFRGYKLFGKILEWAIDMAGKKGLKYIRMDTWADSPKIIDYYRSFGFRFLENYTTGDSPELPLTNRNLALALLQFDLAAVPIPS